MKIIYGQYGNEKFYARAEGEKVYPIKGLPYDGICEDGRVLNAKDVTLLAPCRPGKIVAVGLNYLKRRLRPRFAEGGWAVGQS